MGFFQYNKLPTSYNPGYLKRIFDNLKTAINFLDKGNFPNGLDGSIINSRTLAMSAIAPQPIVVLPILSLATAYSTTSTTSVNVGQYIMWIPAEYTSTCKCILEVTAGSGTAGKTATIELTGLSGTLSSITTNLGSFEVKRSEEFTPPTTSQSLLLKIKTSDSSSSASILGAKLIIKL